MIGFGSSQRHYFWLNMGLGQQILTFRRRLLKVLLPMLLGGSGSVAVFVLWHQLLLQEQIHLQTLTQQYAQATVANISEKLTDRINSLNRMSRRWQVQGGTPRSVWEADVIAYSQDFYGIQSIEWVDRFWQVRWIVPLNGHKSARNLEGSPALNRQVGFTVAQTLRQTTLTKIIPLTQSHKGFLVIIPLFTHSPQPVVNTTATPNRSLLQPTSPGSSQQQSSPPKSSIDQPTLSKSQLSTTAKPEYFDGFLVAVFQVPELFSNMLEASGDYIIRLYDGDQLIYTNQDNQIPRSSQSIQLSYPVGIYGVNWRVEVTPLPSLIMRERSLLPTLILIGGLTSVWLFALVIYLTQFSYRRVQKLAESNQKLQKEIRHRQTVEASLRQSEATKQAILTAIPDLLIQMRGNGNYVDFIANSGINIYRGDTNRQSVTPYDILPKELADLRMQYTQQALTTGTMQRYEHQLYIDGQACHEEVRIVPMEGDQVLVLIRNIDERKHQEVLQQQIEQALRESEAKYRHLISNLHAGFVVHAPDTSILLCNVTACELLGLSMEQMQGKRAIDPAWHFLQEDGTIMALADYPVNRVITTHLPLINYVLGIHHPNGRIVWVLVNAIPEFTATDELQQIVITFINISDRKQAEQQLKQLSERFNVAIQSAQIGIWDWNIPTNHLIWDDRMYQLYGIHPDDFLAAYEAWETGVHPDDLAATITALQQALSEDRIFDTEFRVLWPDGTVRFLKAYGLVQRDFQAQPVRMIGVNYDITDRKQAEEALRVSEERWELALRGNNDGIWDWNIKTNEVFFSTRWKEMLGYADHEIQNHLDEWSTRVHPDDLSGVIELIQAHFAQKTPFYLSEHRVRCKDGSYKWILDRGQALWDADGKPIRMAGSHTDITHRKASELALASSEATKQAIIAAIPDLLIRMQADGTYLEFRATPEFKVLHADLLGQEVNNSDVLPSHLAERRMYYTQQAFTTGKLQVYEQEISISDRLLYEEVRIVPIDPEQVLIMVRDITDRKQAEIELRHQKEQVQIIVDNIPVMVALFDTQGKIQLVNPELERILGWSFQEWQQQNLLLACYPDPAYRQEVLMHMLAANGTWKDVQTVNAWGDVIETSWANVRLSNGMILGIGQDIRDRKRVEQAMRHAMEAAEAANLAKSTFLANMSHELRTPLNVILGFTQVMAREPQLSANLRQDLATIQRSGDHLLALINDVLDLSKIEAGHFSLDLGNIDLLNLLHSIHTMLLERAKAKQISLVLDIAPNVPQFIVADSQKLRQILINLLGNALKFTKRGSVTLSVQSLQTLNHQSTATPTSVSAIAAHAPSSTLLQMQVIDTGVGISPEEQAVVFDAFVQTQAGKRSAQGTGLGLAISRKLVELMNGELLVQSELGVGTTFTLTLPVNLTNGSDQLTQHDPRLVIGLVPGQPHRRILVVDDQPENRLLMIKLMSQIGLEVREASNGLEAVEIWREWRPDLTWMDIRMPILDGYEATKWIREYERAMGKEVAPQPSPEHSSPPPIEPPTSSCTPSIIIALTAQASRSDRTLALEAGCDDYLSKPFHESALLHKMASYLGLEYIYATRTAEELQDRSTDDSTTMLDADGATVLFGEMLQNLPDSWIQSLEEAAIRGDDRAIAALLNELPPAYSSLALQFTAWSESYQFEQILNLIQTGLADSSSETSNSPKSS